MQPQSGAYMSAQEGQLDVERTVSNCDGRLVRASKWVLMGISGQAG